MSQFDTGSREPRIPWNKGRLVGQEPPLKLKEIWAIRIRLELAGHLRDLALFNLAIDSKLRACDLVRLRISDISNGATKQTFTTLRETMNINARQAND